MMIKPVVIDYLVEDGLAEAALHVVPDVELLIVVLDVHEEAYVEVVLRGVRTLVIGFVVGRLGGENFPGLKVDVDRWDRQGRRDGGGESWGFLRLIEPTKGAAAFAFSSRRREEGRQTGRVVGSEEAFFFVLRVGEENDEGGADVQGIDIGACEDSGLVLISLSNAEVVGILNGDISGVTKLEIKIRGSRTGRLAELFCREGKVDPSTRYAWWHGVVYEEQKNEKYFEWGEREKDSEKALSTVGAATNDLGTRGCAIDPDINISAPALLDLVAPPSLASTAPTAVAQPQTAPVTQKKSEEVIWDW
ncbi:hypothetical protein B0H14DRAFT_2581565 [Mycena olivaceomarginata]|nr:hypothetical protein B0H14DRAFT_2581565 [Mycena olivaceomarginata]